MTGFTHPELNGRTLPAPPLGMEHLHLPLAEQTLAASTIATLFLPARTTTDAALWREFAPMLYQYDFSAFMSDASAETYHRQSCSIYTREQLDKSWCAMAGAPIEMREVLAKLLLQHFEDPEYGIAAQLKQSNKPDNFRFHFDGRAPLYWFAGDTIRAARVALPTYAATGNSVGLEACKQLLFDVLENIAAQNLKTDDYAHEIRQEVAAILKQELSCYSR